MIQIPEAIIITLIATLFPTLISLYGVWIQHKRQEELVHPEKEKLESESDSALAESAKKSAEVAMMYSARVTELEKSLSNLKVDFDNEKKRCDDRTFEFERMIKEAKEFNEVEFRAIKDELQKYKDWTIRLIHQIKSYGYEPVPFIQEKKGE